MIMLIVASRNSVKTLEGRVCKGSRSSLAPSGGPREALPSSPPIEGARTSACGGLSPSRRIARFNTLPPQRRIAVFESTPALDYRAVAPGQLAKWQARRVHAYVEAHLDTRLKVSEIAGSVHLSSSHFSRAFKRTFGMTVHAWVMRRRIEMAQGMMLSTPHTLSEIALHCGLSDQSHLTRWFRRVVGMTPG